MTFSIKVDSGPSTLAHRQSSAGPEPTPPSPSSSSSSTNSTAALLGGQNDRQALNAVKPAFSFDRIQQGGYAPGIEGLRGFAILLTAYSHVAKKPFAATSPLGACGVTIFFVLSGYNIMGTLVRTSKAASADNSWRSRLVSAHIHRFKRLLPSILTMIVTMNVLNAYLHTHRPWAHMARYSTLAATFTYNTQSLWINGDPGPFINMWSLGPTEQFNVLMSLIGPTLMSFSDGKKRAALYFVIIATFVLRVYTSAYPDNFLHMHWHYDMTPNLWRFLTGAALRYTPLPQVLHRSSSIYLGVFTVLLAPYLMTYPQPNYRSMAPGWADIVAPMTLWGDVLCAVGACLVIAGCRTVSSSPAHFDGRSANWLMESKPLQFFGKVSYTFYLFQLPLLIASDWPRGWVGFAFECLSLVFAMATTYWVEPVARAWLDGPSKTARQAMHAQAGASRPGSTNGAREGSARREKQ